jgi:hypothetical protein
MIKRGHMKKRYVVVMVIASAAILSSPVFADDETAGGGSVVVADGESCPSGKVVSGLTGGQGDVTKVCVTPNSAAMTEDTEDVGDPNTSS